MSAPALTGWVCEEMALTLCRRGRRHVACEERKVMMAKGHCYAEYEGRGHVECGETEAVLSVRRQKPG